MDFNSKHTDQIEQIGAEFEKYSMKAFNVIENKHCESFLPICSNNFNTQNISWLWECRGKPTSFTNFQ